jgi:hypothetical protein
MGTKRIESLQVWLAGLMVLAAISGCSAPPQSVTNPVATSLPITATTGVTSAMPVTPEATVTQTATPVPATSTRMNTATPTRKPSPKPTWTPSPTWFWKSETPTPGPTQDAETEALVLDLLHNNGGCELPCWWGFTPGKTYWTTARDFFLSKGIDFSDPTFLPFQKRGIFDASFRVEKYGFNTGADFFVENGIIKLIESGGRTYWAPDTTKFGDPFYLKAMEKYLLSEILISQGKPEQVLIYIIPNKAIDLPDYYLLLFYPEKGILVEYDGQSKQFGEDLRLCPQTAFVYFKLWSPEAGLSLKEAFSYERFLTKGDQLNFLNYFRPWEKASGRSIDDFVNKFKASNACFITPTWLWGRK